MRKRLNPRNLSCLLVASVLLAGTELHSQTNVPVPKQSFTSGQLHQKLRTFTAAEIGQRPTFAGMHRGHLIISGGYADADRTNGKLSTWRLSTAGAPNAVNPSRLGVHENNAIFKSHAMGFSGELTQIRASKFTLYDLTDMSAPGVTSVANGGVSSSHSSCWAGKYIYTGGEGYGTASGYVDIWDVGNPAAPVFIRSLDVPTITGFRCASVYVIGNVLVVSASLTNGVATFDLSDPTDPQLLDVNRDDTGANTYTSYLSGNRLYGGGQDGGFFVYDLSDPRDIQVVGHMHPGGTIRYPVLQDEYIHVGNLGNGRYQKIRIDTMPPTLVADVTGFPQAEVAIPIGNLVFVGTASSSPTTAGWLIPHDTAVDNRGPEVNAIRPANGETNVATTTMIGVSFTDLLDGPSINTSSVIVRPQGGSALTGTYSHMGGIVNFSPASPLTPNTTYEVVVVANGVKDCSGNGVASQTITTFSTGTRADTTTLGLELHYPLDETGGTVANDHVGVRHGTLQLFPATPWTDVAAVGRGALNFDGVNDYVETASMDVGNTFAISAYVKIPSGSTGVHTVAANTASGTTASGWRIMVDGSASATPGRVSLHTGNGSVGNNATTANGAFGFDRWTHVAVTVDRSNGTAVIWIDGANKTSDNTIRNDFNTTAVIQWGRQHGGGEEIQGSMDDLRLYSRILDNSDIRQLRDLAAAPLAHWRLNGNGVDSTPNQRALSVGAGGAGAGTSYSTADTMEGTASLTLDGISGHAMSPVMELGTAFTASAWVKIQSGTSTLHTIFGNTTGGYSADGWKCFVYGSTHATTAGRVQIETGNATAGNAALTAVGMFPFDTWCHVAVGVDRSLGKARIYLNGVDRTVDESIRNDFKTHDRVHLGQMSNNSYRLNGSLDDVRLYARWLEDHEIALLGLGKLLGHWEMEGKDDDASGFDRFITRRNGAIFSSNAFKGTQSLGYDGVNDYANTTAIDLGDQFTLSVWAWLPSGLPAGSKTLLANSPGGSLSNGFRWFVHNWNTNNMSLVFETANGTASANIYAPAGTFVPGQWNHLAMVVNRSTGTADIYCNRIKVNTGSTVRNDFANNTAFHIGAFTNGGAPWQGQLDEVRIYGKTASAANIATLGYGSPNAQPVISSLASSSAAQTTNSSVTFTAGATDANVGEVLQYHFNFGDGASSGWQAGNTATHTYAVPGRYVVTVSVFDGYETVTRSMTQIVYNPVTATPPSNSGEMAYDSSRSKVWCVVPDGDNHDNNISTPPTGSVVRFDAVSLAVDYRVQLGDNVEAVACALRPGSAELWVVCKNTRLANGQVKVVNAGTGTLITTLNLGRGFMPTGIAFAPDDSGAFIACEGAEGVLKYHPTNRTLLATRDINGPARGIAVSSNSSRVFVTRFRSPNSGGQVLELAASTLNVTRTFTLSPDTTTIDGPNSSRGLPNYLMQAVITPDGRKLWIPAKKDNIYRGKYRDGNDLTHENTVRSLVMQLDLIANNEPANTRLDLDNAHFPAALCFSPRGDLVFAAMIGNEQITVIDAATRSTLSPINTATGSALFGHAPSGICVSPDGQRLYVHNFMERKVKVFNISQLTAGTGSAAPLAGQVNLVLHEPLAANVLIGKQLFHNAQDPRLALEGYISCASCHIGGDHDGRTWDLGNFGEGLRQTIDLRGHGGMSQGALHWSANFNEVQDFEGQIRDLSGGSGLITSGSPHPPLGTSNAGRSADLDALAAYVASLDVGLFSPFRQSSGSLTSAAVNGQTHFTSKSCNTCHSGAQFTDSNVSTFLRHDIGTMTSSSGNRLKGTLGGIDSPTLKALWSKGPYLHRGQAATLEEVFNTTHAPGTADHARFRELTPAQQAELIEYLLQIE